MINAELMPQYTAFLPQLASGLVALLVMLAIAVRRCHRTVATVTVLGLLGTLATVPFAMTAVPQAATGLFIMDGQACAFTALILCAAILVALLMWSYLGDWDGNREEMYLLLTISVNGALMLVTARHLASLFVSLELMSVPVYGMAGYLFTQRRSLESATKYLVLSATATAVMLFGMAFLYAQTGRMDFAGIATAFSTGFANDTTLAQAGLALLFVGIAFKLSLAPFHAWTLDVYEGAPAPVGAYLATVGKVAVVAMLVRLLTEGGVFGAFVGAFPAMPAWSLLNAVALLAVLSILVGNLLALRQHNLKRLLAASSIANFGYLLVAVIAGDSFSHEAVTMFAITYVATTLVAFGVLSALSRAGDGIDVDTITMLRGLSRRSPFLAFMLTISLLSLAGVPLTAGFVGKFYIFLSGAAAGLWWLLSMVIVGSAIGLFYYLRVIAAIYQGDENAPALRPAASSAVLAVAVAFAIVVVIGIWPQPVAGALQHAVLSHLP